MARTRRRRSRRGGKKWWQFWKKEPKPTPLSFNNAEMVKKPARPTSRFDPRAYDKNADTARMMKAAMETDYQRDSKPTKMDARANNTQGGKGRFRKRTRRRRRRRKRRRSRRRRSRRRRSRRRRH